MKTNKRYNNPLNFIELFAGVGGFRVGLNHVRAMDDNGRAIEQGHWDCVFMNQWEPSTRVQKAFDCYVKRFGNEFNECSNEDISKVDAEQIPMANLLVGGFPCQDYSVARSLNNELGIEGKKGVLFWEIARILQRKHIPFVLLENVDRLLISPSKYRGRDFSIILKTLDTLGYNVEYRVINAGDYGMPQRRRRVFIFAYKKSTNYASTRKDMLFDVFPYEIIDGLPTIDLNLYQDVAAISAGHSMLEAPSGACPPLMDDKRSVATTATSSDSRDGMSFQYGNCGIMENGVVNVYKVGSIQEECKPLRGILLDDEFVNPAMYLDAEKEKKLKYMKGAKRVLRYHKDGTPWYYSEGAMAFPDVLDTPGRTMLTSEGTVNRSSHVVADSKGKLRFLDPIEAERLQMFPDGWTDVTMTNRQRYFMMGNALVTGIVSRIEPKLREIVQREE